MASVSHQGMNQPGAFPLRGTDGAEDIGPFGALVAGCIRGRVPRLAHRRVSLFF